MGSMLNGLTSRTICPRKNIESLACVKRVRIGYFDYEKDIERTAQRPRSNNQS